MDKQTSFTLKPTKFLFLSVTISSSVIFLIFISIWVFNFTPSSLQHKQETQFQFNNESSSLAFTRTVHTLASFHGEVQDSTLSSTHFSTPQDVSKTGGGVHVKQRDDEQVGPIGKGTIFNSSNLSAESVENSTDFSQVLATEKQKDLLETEKASPSSKGRSCDVTKGKWVFDESYPLYYTNGTCPFIDEGFSCETNGRLDKDYMKWRWQPQDCDLPRFNASKMLELIRGKRLVFVGDSINRNQWESMLCLLMGAVKDPKKVYETHGRRITKEKGNYCFKFVDYKCTVEFYVSHFLVHESKARVGKKRVQTLRIDAVDKGSSRWRGADILVFNTAHWWNHHKTKAGINYYQEGGQVYPRLDVSEAFRRAMVTWGSWVDRHVNPRKTRVFFRSSAPSHFSGGQWDTGGHCREATKPIDEMHNPRYPEKNRIVEGIINQMKTRVIFLNITAVSDYRIDGHPSVYGSTRGKRSGVQDCSHWCLPGVPDTWNEMLYYHLLYKERHQVLQN